MCRCGGQNRAGRTVSQTHRWPGRAEKDPLPPNVAACFQGGNEGWFNWRIPYVVRAPSQRSAARRRRWELRCHRAALTPAAASRTPQQPVLIISISSSADRTLLRRVSQSQKAPGPCPLPGAGASPWSAWHRQIAELSECVQHRQPCMCISHIFIINTIFHFNGFFLLLKAGKRRKEEHNALKAHGINRMVLINVYTSKAGRKKCRCYTA